jgi:hypothetical protein
MMKIRVSGDILNYFGKILGIIYLKMYIMLIGGLTNG